MLTSRMTSALTGAWTYPLFDNHSTQEETMGFLRPKVGVSSTSAVKQHVGYLLASSYTGLLFLGIALYLFLSQPWLGIEVQPGQDGRWRISHVEEKGVFPKQYIGAAIVAFGLAKHHQSRITTLSADLVRQPDTLPTYGQFNRFLDRQQSIDMHKKAEGFTLWLEDAGPLTGPLTVKPKTYRPLGSVPLDFWLLLVAGFTAWLFTSAVWVFRNNFSIGGWLIIAAGFGYLLLAMCHAIYSNREISLPLPVIIILTNAAYFGALLFAFSTFILASLFPSKIITIKTILIFTAIALLLWINNALQLYQWPIHAYFFPFISLLTLSIPVVAYQAHISQGWKRNHHQFRCILLSMLATISAAVLFYVLPLAFKAAPIVGDTFFILLLFSLFVAFGSSVFYFSLFNIHKWWRYVLKIWCFSMVNVIFGFARCICDVIGRS